MPNPNCYPNLNLNLIPSFNPQKAGQHSKNQPKYPYFPKMTSFCWLKTHAGPQVQEHTDIVQIFLLGLYIDFHSFVQTNPNPHTNSNINKFIP